MPLLLVVISLRASASPAFDTRCPVSFFTNVASRLLASEMNLDLTRIEIYPTNQYTPAVQRLLQVTANVYDATTTNRFPTVFRPLFSSDATGTNIFISGYRQVTSVTGITDSQLAAPLDPTGLAYARTPFTNRAVNVYGIPWIIGVKKGLPNFNEFYMRDLTQIMRKLQVSRPNARSTPTATNQMLFLTITNRLGYSFWNSYDQDYVPSSGHVTISLRDTLEMTLTNETAQWNHFYTQPRIVQFAWSTNLTVWPGANWSGNTAAAPLYQTPAPASFVSGYWDFTFLPESVYQTSTGTFVPISSLPSWETNEVHAPLLPQFGLAATNWLQAFILDGTNVLDYVELRGPNQMVDLTGNLIDNPSNSYDLQSINTGTAMWDTNLIYGVFPQGVVNQIFVSRFGQAISTDGFWEILPNIPPALKTPQAEAEYFNAFFTGGAFIYNNKIYFDTNTVIEAPYIPRRSVWDFTLWQANDPLVHYQASDLATHTGLTGVHRSEVSPWVSSYPNPNLSALGQHYQPWGRNSQMSQTTGTDPGAYNYGLRDPLVWNPDDWDFPTGQTTGHLDWLGRVHRGTPWQTIYLKQFDVLQESQSNGASLMNIGTNTWEQWCGVTNPEDIQLTRPVADWRLASLLVAMLSTNHLTNQFSVNNPDTNAWSKLLEGLTFQTNTTAVPTSMTTPTFNNLVISSNSPQARTIAAAIVSARSRKPFYDLGDLLAVPELSDQSPFLNWNNLSQQEFGISDQAYEALSSQLLPLVCSDSFGSIRSSNGLTQVSFSGYDGHEYVLQGSTNLLQWRNLATNSPVNGNLILTVPLHRQSFGEFYRSRLLQ